MMAKSSSLKNSILSWLLAVARWDCAHPLIRLFYPSLNRFLPVARLAENADWMAFHHPHPEYPLHILILPKQGIPSLTSAPNDNPELYTDLFLLVQQLIRDFQLDQRGYRLISNGGPNQSIPIWHWHLTSDAPGVVDA